MSAQVWRDEKLNTEKRHITEEKEFQKYLENFLKQNNEVNIDIHMADSAESIEKQEDVDDETLESKKQALLDMLF